MYLSTTGRILRVDAVPRARSSTASSAARRSKHDAILSTVDTTSRGEIGAITDARAASSGSRPSTCRPCPPTRCSSGPGARIADYLALADKTERVLARRVARLADCRSRSAPAQGVVKRVTPGDWPNRPEFEVITLKPGDEVVGRVQCSDDAELVFVTTDAQLLHFTAKSVRPQGALGGRHGRHQPRRRRASIFFGAVEAADRDQAAVVTIAVSRPTRSRAPTRAAAR